jgi:hypothetical protein
MQITKSYPWASWCSTSILTGITSGVNLMGFALFSCFLQYHILSNSLALLSRPDVAKSVIQLLWSDLTAQVGAVSSCFWTSRDGAVFVWSCSLLQVKQLIRQLYNSFLRLQILGDVSCVHQCLAQVFPGRIRKHWQRCFSGNWWSRYINFMYGQ